MQPLLLLHNRAAGAALSLRHTTRLVGLSPAATASRGRGPMDSTSRQIHTERVLQADGTDSGVRVMHLNKPDTLNSLTVTMAGAFEEALQQLSADTAARALIITGRQSAVRHNVKRRFSTLPAHECGRAQTAPAGVGDRAFSAGGDFDFIQQRMASTVGDNAQVCFVVCRRGTRSNCQQQLAASNSNARGYVKSSLWGWW